MQVWKNYVCQVSASGICVTPGRLTPTFYNQMAAGVNVSYGLYHYGPFLVELQDCTFVRETITDIYRDYCPGLRRYSKWIYTGLVMVSTAVMLSLIFWVIYGRERRHRVYTKRLLAHLAHEGGKGFWRKSGWVVSGRDMCWIVLCNIWFLEYVNTGWLLNRCCSILV